MKADMRAGTGVRWLWAVAVCLIATLSGCGKDRQSEASATKRHALTVPGLVAAYGFDEPSGNVANDDTENAHDGTLDGQSRVTGKYGGALQFGENYVSVADGNLLDLSDGMTLSAWIKPSQ